MQPLSSGNLHFSSSLVPVPYETLCKYSLKKELSRPIFSDAEFDICRSSLTHTHKSEFTHACVRVRVCERWRGWVLTSVFFFYTFVCLRACVRAKVVAGGQPAGLSFMENCAKGI